MSPSPYFQLCFPPSDVQMWERRSILSPWSWSVIFFFPSSHFNPRIKTSAPDRPLAFQTCLKRQREDINTESVSSRHCKYTHGHTHLYPPFNPSAESLLRNCTDAGNALWQGASSLPQSRCQTLILSLVTLFPSLALEGFLVKSCCGEGDRWPDLTVCTHGGNTKRISLWRAAVWLVGPFPPWCWCRKILSYCLVVIHW